MVFYLIHKCDCVNEVLIDDLRINERVTHSDRRRKFLKKMTNRAPLHGKLYYAFVPPSV